MTLPHDIPSKNHQKPLQKQRLFSVAMEKRGAMWYDEGKQREVKSMEFHENLQALRKQRGLTQEELAAELFVSRTAISKWESGRGYPSIDSLKAISRFFGVSIDGLLSGEEVLSLAQEDQKRSGARLRDQVFGLLDCGAGLLLFLPVFGQQTGNQVRAVNLFSLFPSRPWLCGLFLGTIVLTAGLGCAILALQGWAHTWKRPLSLALSALGVLLFLLARQPYAGAFFLFFRLIKVFFLVKNP